MMFLIHRRLGISVMITKGHWRFVLPPKGTLIIAQCHANSQPWPYTFVYKRGCLKGGCRLPLGATGDS